MEVTPRLYSLEELCDLLQCESEEWIKERVRTGQFPARRVCRHLRFSVRDIEAIIDACAITDNLPMVTSRQGGKDFLVSASSNVRVGAKRGGNSRVA